MEKTDIIIPSWNTLPYLKKCLESIRKKTKQGTYEIFIVERNSTDGSLQYVQDNNYIHIIHTEKMGYAPAMNIGTQMTHNKYVCWFNSDVEAVTNGWLEILTEVIKAKPSIGIISPLVRTAETKVIKRTGVGNTIFTPGVVWLMKRDTINMVGDLCEDFGYGLMEDVDYVDRVHDEKLEVFVVGGSIVDHYEHKTFQANKIDMKSLNQDNARKYTERRKQIVGYRKSLGLFVANSKYNPKD